MALIRANSGSGGGSGSPEVLWTNTSPTTAISSPYTITLSKSIENYDYIKFTFRVSTSVATEMSVIASVSDVKNSIGNRPGLSLTSPFGANTSSQSHQVRRIIYTSNTGISIQSLYPISGFQSDLIIPTSVSGIKL